MTYEIIVSPTAEDDLKKFDSEIQRRFYKKIEKLKYYPKSMESHFVNLSKANGN